MSKSKDRSSLEVKNEEDKTTNKHRVEGRHLKEVK